MGAFEPTASQKRAIETRGSSILVSAGAGSGKTRVVTERVLTALLDPEDPASVRQFLIITFTKAAAAELKSRIAHAISDAMRDNPGNRWLKEQHLLCQQATIGTIHSFCQTILKENSHVLGIAPDFRVLDEDRAALMKRNAIERVMEARYEKLDELEGFEELVNMIGSGRDDSRLVELALDVHKKMQSHADPDKWAQEQKHQYLTEQGTDPGQTIWGMELMAQAKEQTSYWEKILTEIAQEMAAGYEEAYKKWGEGLEDLRQQLHRFRLGLEQNWHEAARASEIVFVRLSVTKSIDSPFMQKVKSLRNLCKGQIQKITEPFQRDPEQLMAEIRTMAPAMCALMDLVLDFSEEYQKAKRRASLLDFSDLEHEAVRLLEDDAGNPSLVAQALSERFREIMVDEYQDVSEVQEHIFNAISKDQKNLFMVGDVKQSIYRFRLADPQIFLKKYNSYADAENAAEDEPKKILLQENFRSRKEIIEVANHTFRTCMSPAVGEILYDEDAALHYGAVNYTGEIPVPELLILGSEESEPEESPDKIRSEATLVAQQIRMLMESGSITEGDHRPVRFEDIAILLRAANTVGKVYQEVLEENGIPAVAGTGGSFFRMMEVSTVISLLTLIDNPHQDIPLIAVLNSPLFGVSPDELTRLRAGQEEGAGCYEAVKKEEDDIPACHRFLVLLEKYRLLSPDISLSALLWMIYDDLDVMAIYGAMIGGELRRENLLTLMEYTRKFEETGYHGVRRFLQWLHNQEERGQTPTGAGDEGNAVQIMSIHQSKGLEFPIVFLSDTGRQFNKTDSREIVLVHPRLGLGPKMVDLEQRVAYPTIARLAIRNRLEHETISEEMRLLYVAMTRAKERLIITGSMKNPEKTVEEQAVVTETPMNVELIAKAAAPLIWVLYAALADDGGKIRWRIVRQLENSEVLRDHAPEERDTASEEKWELKLKENLAFQYPHGGDTELPSKLTATELKRRLAKTDDEMQPEERSLIKKDRAKFVSFQDYLRHKETGSTRRGTLTHLVLQNLDFKTAETETDIRDQILKMQKDLVLGKNEAALIDVPSILRFLESDLGKQMKKNADNLNREFTFSVLVPSKELLEDGTDEKVLLQGAIDCWFEEADGIVLVDYKTDHVFGEELDERVEKYKSQMHAYSIALSEMIAKPIRRKVLYFLSAGVAVEVKDTDL